jgi:Hydrazine synthase alpha subunit middle domain
MKKYFILSILTFCYYFGVSQTLQNPIMFCTQVPQPYGFGTLFDVFNNHQANMFAAPRGGNLYIRYPNGTLKNLTQTAGFGQTGRQGATSISVRDPAVHWSGTKAIFSMVIGAPTQQYQVASFRWKLYEITGLGQNETPVITLVPNQPVGYNNVQPIYGTDDKIIFTTDMPRGGIAHLYPQHDEYESTPIVSGIWKLDPNACSGVNALEMLTHSPSGDFTPFIDKAGRLIFTRWDHLQRDQQADGDIRNYTTNGTFNYADETANASKSSISIENEVFPEPRAVRSDLLALPQWANTNPQNFNIFNPWMMNEDGTELEMLNHLGRHEMGNYMTQNFTNDPNLHDFYTPVSPTPIRGMLQIQESPVTPGLYYGTEAPEFGTHGSGMIVSVNAPPGMHPEQIAFTYVTHPDTRIPDATPSVNHSGLYRNPVPLADGKILVSHSQSTEADQNIGTSTAPLSKADYRLRLLEPTGSHFKANLTTLTGTGISKSVSWWSPDQLMTYNGVLWETYPVEVRARTLPTTTTLNPETVAPSEQALFTNAGVNLHDFRKFLKRNDLSVLAIRDVTSRDDADQQQPFNLKVSGSTHQTINPSQPNTIYEVKHLQFLQNDMLRGIGGINTPRAGRRGIAQFLHDPKAITYNPPTTGSQGSTNIHPDGSAAMIVPAKRALTWQLTDANNKGIVRERLWLSTKAGEVRTCTSCHGESTLNQAGFTSPTNAPQALTTLLNHVKVIDSDNDGIKDIYDAFPYDNTKHIAEAVNEKFTTNLVNWINQNVDNDAVTWTTQSNTCNANSAMINNRAIDNTGKIDRLRKVIDLSNMDLATLTFDVAYARYDATKFDRLKVYAVSCTGIQTLIYDKSGTDLATAPDQTALFTPTDCSQWRTETIDLSAYANKMVELVFENIGGWSNRLFLDNILIQELGVSPPCVAMNSIANGQWNDPNTWSCGRIPDINDLVTIGHNVSVSGMGFCKNIGYVGTGKIDILSGGKLKINTP